MISVCFNTEFNFLIHTVFKVYVLRDVQQIYDVAYISISHRSWKKMVIQLIIKCLFNYVAK